MFGSPGGGRIRTFLTFTIVAAIGYPDKRRPARTAYEFIGRLPGSLVCTVNDWRKHPEPLSQYRNPIYLARVWQDALAAGVFPSQSHLAQGLGISGARVSQMLRLLGLSP